MIYVLYENPYNIICSFKTELYKQFPLSSRYVLSGRNKTNVEIFKRPPLFNQGWMIECTVDCQRTDIEKIEGFSIKNILLFHTVNKKQLSDILALTDGLTVKLIDNFKLKEETVILWIISELNCSEKVAIHLFKKLRGNLRNIIANVSMLKQLGCVTEKSIDKYVKITFRKTPSDLVQFLLFGMESKLSFKDAVKVVYEYRHGMRWLIEFLIKQLNIYLDIFNEMVIGELDMLNYVSYQKSCSNKSIASLSERELLFRMKSFGAVSIEYITYLVLRLNSLPKGKLSLIYLIQILKVTV